MELDRYMKRSEVEGLLGLSRSTLYRMMQEGRFVKPHRMGKAAVRWRYSEILEWIASESRR